MVRAPLPPCLDVLHRVLLESSQPSPNVIVNIRITQRLIKFIRSQALPRSRYKYICKYELAPYRIDNFPGDSSQIGVSFVRAFPTNSLSISRFATPLRFQRFYSIFDPLMALVLWIIHVSCFSLLIEIPLWAWINCRLAITAVTELWRNKKGLRERASERFDWFPLWNATFVFIWNCDECFRSRCSWNFV